MRKNHLATVLALVAALALSVLASAPRQAEARPVCPSDGVSRTTSGSTATGSTCDQALSNLASQEWPKINCPYGIYSYTFVYNSCAWNGWAYQVTGWYQYYCQTDCYNTDP